MAAVPLAAIELQDLLGPAATLVAAAVSATLIVRQLSALRRRNEFDVLSALGERLHDRFRRPTDRPSGDEHPFYALRWRFSEVPRGDTRSRREHERDVVCRVKRLSELDYEDEYQRDLAVLEPVVNALSELGEAVDHGYVSSSRLLSRYHLLIIRASWIIEPYVISEVVLGARGRWGMRVLELGSMARAYNDMNPIHRRSVYFLRSRAADKGFGVMYEAPRLDGWGKFTAVWWALRRRTLGYPRISERSKRRQNRMLERYHDRLKDAHVAGASAAPSPAE